MHLPDRGQIDHQLVALDPRAASGHGELVRVRGCRLGALSARAREQTRDQIAHGDRTLLRQAQADALRKSRAPLGDQEGLLGRGCDQQFLAERDHLDGAVLGQQILRCGDLGLRPDAEHGLDPGIIDAVPAGSEMTARLCVQRGRNALGGHLTPVPQLDAGVRLLRRCDAEDLRRDRVALRPEHHQEAVFDHGACQAEIKRCFGRGGRRKFGPAIRRGRGFGECRRRRPRLVVEGQSDGHGVSPSSRFIALRRMAGRERGEITLVGQA